ncbi:MAG TPA: class I SAM-dependent methyltransferase [Pirellulales bacterium]
MAEILEAEAERLVQQRRLDQLKTAKERNQWGQFATPPALSLEIARYAWNRLRHREGSFHFLDPAIGTGSFFGAFAQTFPKERIDSATGIELDKPFAETATAIWRRYGLRVIHGDFTKQPPEPIYNVVLTNPPYVRHHHLAADDKRRLAEQVQAATGVRLSGLAGLYCYFLLQGHAWLAQDALAVWLIPSEFMDVNYGDEVKRYLLDRVCLVQIHRFCPSDVQFDDALVSSAVVIFEKRKPSPGHQAVFSFGGSLLEPANVEEVSLDQLRATRKWTSLPRRQPDVGPPGVCNLGDFFTVKRGLATGNNDFFILPKARLAELGIPMECVRPILPSPRFLQQEIVRADPDGWPQIERQLALIDCHADETVIRERWPRFADYLQSGKRQSVHEGYLTSRRIPWYSQEKREPAPFVCTYMGRSLKKPFRFIWNRTRATAANVYLLLYPKDFVSRQVSEKAEDVFKALRAIQPQHFLSEGRVYGGGLHKMEPAELMRLPAGDLATIFDSELHRQRSLF